MASTKILNAKKEVVNEIADKIKNSESVVLFSYQGLTVADMAELRNKVKKNQFEEKIVSILDDYKGLFAIQSFHLSILKWFYKNRKNYVTGYLICKKNCMKDYFFKKYDYLNVNILLFNDNRIKRMRANKLVIGYKVLNKAEYNRVNTLYDNLEFDNILEIDTDE